MSDEMEFAKTPVSILEEFCKKQKFKPPDFEEIGVDRKLKIFEYVVFTCGYVVKGEGKSKKQAKHAACAQLISYLLQTNRFKDHVTPIPVASDQLQPKPTFNAISTLFELCVQKRWPVAQFKDLPSIGPSHNRQYAAVCRVSIKETTGRSKTKKGARQVAAAEMLKILHNIEENSDEEQIPMAEYEEPERIWQKYRAWRIKDVKREKKFLSDRHNYFLQLPKDVRKACYDILNDTEYCSHRDIVDRICKTLQLAYDISPIHNHRLKHETFSLNGTFDVVLVGHGEKLYTRVVDYFKTMFNFQCISIENELF